MSFELPGDDRSRILALDDEREIVRSLARALRARGFDTDPFTDVAEALGALTADPDCYDAALLDVSLPRISGIEVLKRAKRIAPDLPIVMLTGDDSARTAVEALRAGAFGYLTKAIDDVEHIALTLNRAVQHGQLHRRVRRPDRLEGFERLVGASSAIRRVFSTVERLAESDISVLILGESGTGKELVARAIHDRNTRAPRSFVALNCGAIPEALVDSELFGHTRGAFTGAVGSRTGAFEQANGGTLFLDEIGDIPAPVQLRLLRVLQEREVVPVGGSGPRPVDVRVIAATHVDMEQAVAEGRFRADLYYRLNVANLRLPSLRERLDDVPLLIAHFIKKHAERLGRSVPNFSGAVVEALSCYTWPGNVRELENVVQRMIALAGGDAIGLESLPARFIGEASSKMPSVLVPTAPAADELAWADDVSFAEARRQVQERFERAYVQRLLGQVDGNIAEAARRAGMDRSNFRRIMNRSGRLFGKNN